MCQTSLHVPDGRAGLDCYAVKGPYHTHLGIAIDLGILMKTPSGNPARGQGRGNSPRPAGTRDSGPTCDTIDFMPGPFLLPARAIGGRFNGYGHFDEAILLDEPLASLYPAEERAWAEREAQRA